MLLPLIGLTASQFIASAAIGSVMLGLNYQVAVTIVAVVVTIYAVMGGLWSVTLTDFVQVFLIVIGMIIAIPYALGTAGGWDNVVSNVPVETFDMFRGITPLKVFSLVIMYIASFTVGQEAVSRYYAARDAKAAVQGSMLSAFINFIYAFVPTILGIITLALINMNRIDGGVVLSEGARYALPHLAIETMPPIIVGLLFAGIISATMSSADSDLLGAGSIFGNDIFKIYLKKDATSDQVMKVTRGVMILVGVFAWIIAMNNTSSIIDLLMFSFTLRAAGSFFPYIFGLYWKKASAAGTVASLILGSVVVVILEKTSLSFFGLDPILPGLLVSLIVFVAVSLISPNAKDSTDLEYEAN